MKKILAFFKNNKFESFVMVALVTFVYVTMPFLGYDNPLEQAVEWVIKVWSGAEVELSPEALEEHLPIEDFSPNP